MTPFPTAVPQSTFIPKQWQPARNERLQNVDMMKGLLVLLVIVGHTIRGEMHDNFLKYVTIVFRMPLLIGLSGFMFSYDKIKTYSLPALLKKYKTRMIIPWVLAVLFYTFFININKLHVFQVHTLGETLFHAFFFPFPHLWYIVGLLSWIVLTWVLSKLRFKLVYVVYAAAFLSPVLLLFHIGFLEVTHPVAKFIIYTIRPFYYFFFVFGVYLKSLAKPTYAASWHRPVTIVLAAFLLLLFYYFNPYLYALLTIVFDALLLVLILDSIKGEKFSTNKVLEWAGKNSMAIYLWHQIPLLILASVVGRNKPMLFYSLTFVSEIALLYAIFLLSKISFIRIYFFGVR